MTRSPASPEGLSARQRRIALGLALLVLAVFAGANLHLILVSVASQPDCVAEGGAALRAAKPSC
jgi:hypothetical protein